MKELQKNGKGNGLLTHKEHHERSGQLESHHATGPLVRRQHLASVRVNGASNNSIVYLQLLSLHLVYLDWAFLTPHLEIVDVLLGLEDPLLTFEEQKWIGSVHHCYEAT